MKVLILNSSPRMKKSNTEKLTTPLIEGIKTRNADISTIYTYGKKINGCNGCFMCYIKESKECVVYKDDFKNVFDEMMDADIIVIASPIYTFSVPANLKAVLDRLHFRFWNGKNIVKDNDVNYYTTENVSRKKRKIITILNSSFDGEEVFQNAVGMIKTFFDSYLNENDEHVFEYIGSINTAFGTLLSSNYINNDNEYFTNLKRLGEELIDNSMSFDETIQMLNQPLYEYIGINRQESIELLQKIRNDAKERYELIVNKFKK